MKIWTLAAAALTGGVLVLAVTSRGGAGGPAAPQPPTLATCDVIKLSALLMDTDKYSKPIAERRTQLAGLLKPLEDELEAMGKQLQALGANAPATPDNESLARRFQEKRQNYAQQSQLREREFEAFRTRTNFDAYQQVVAAAGVIAAKRGYSTVIANRILETARPPENPSVFLQGVLARPVVVSPVADDITAEVMTELKIEEPKPIEGGAKPAPTVPPATTPPSQP